MRDYAMGALAAIIAVLFIAGIVAWGLQYDRPERNPRGGYIMNRVKTVEYNGHEYLYFAHYGLTHNPDCPCATKEAK